MMPDACLSACLPANHFIPHAVSHSNLFANLPTSRRVFIAFRLITLAIHNARHDHQHRATRLEVGPTTVRTPLPAPTTPGGTKWNSTRTTTGSTNLRAMGIPGTPLTLSTLSTVTMASTTGETAWEGGRSQGPPASVHGAAVAAVPAMERAGPPRCPASATAPCGRAQGPREGPPASGSGDGEGAGDGATRAVWTPGASETRLKKGVFVCLFAGSASCRGSEEVGW